MKNYFKETLIWHIIDLLNIKMVLGIWLKPGQVACPPDDKVFIEYVLSSWPTPCYHS